MITQTDLNVILSFFQEIGIPTEASPESFETVGELSVPGAYIHEGRILYDPDRLLSPGDLLHEGGHFAVTIPEWRPLVRNGDLETLFRDNIESIPKFSPSDLPDRSPFQDEHPQYRKVIDGDENTAIAWSYAAAVHLGLDTTTLYSEEAFDGEWSEIEVMLKISHGYSWHHPGVNCLRHIGMTEKGLFPKLTRWLQN